MTRSVASEPSTTVTSQAFAPSLGLGWLITIRWAALLSYGLVFAAAQWWVGFEAHKGALFAIVAAGVASNLALSFFRSGCTIPAKTLMGAAIFFDVLMLAAMLYFCGGFTNPFSMMFLVYVTLAAFFLDERWTWGVFALATAAFLALFFFHVSVPQLDMHTHHGHSSGFSLHLHGMLIAFIVIGVLTSLFVTRMSSDLRQQEKELNALKEKEQERRQLVSLATITAGAAHELATPLATVSLIAEELNALADINDATREDLRTMQQQIRRCEEVLQKMRGSSSELQGEAPKVFTVESVVHEVKLSPECTHHVQFACDGSAHGAMFSLRAALISSLRALIKNGLQATANGFVTVAVEGDASVIRFSVRDEGPGMTAEQLQRMGEPFYTSKSPGEGMGLGVYLVKLFVSQLEGDFSVVSTVGKGTEVSFTIPRNMNV